jgi:cold shock CspA family protein
VVAVNDPAPIPAGIGSPRPGVVASFDDHEGAGTVRDALDGTVWWFHCTRIADGSRLVDVGATVTYRVTTGPTGLEAVDLAPRADGVVSSG